ncbi:MAG: hypothetical protein Q8835_02910 [Sweet potato little leaf phytoplasma]|nr:hypothetical protein [Sweet potato little leaf phytoplasma]
MKTKESRFQKLVFVFRIWLGIQVLSLTKMKTIVRKFKENTLNFQKQKTKNQMVIKRDLFVFFSKKTKHDLFLKFLMWTFPTASARVK